MTTNYKELKKKQNEIHKSITDLTEKGLEGSAQQMELLHQYWDLDYKLIKTREEHRLSLQA